MSKLLIDNNIWAAHEMGYPDIVKYLKDVVYNEDEICSNTIITMELMSHFEVETDSRIKAGREKYLSLASKVYTIDRDIALKAAEIRRQAKLSSRSVPKGPDALIAATAVIHHLTVVSNNDKDFIWASQNFRFPYINPIQDNDAYKDFQNRYRAERDTK